MGECTVLRNLHIKCQYQRLFNSKVRFAWSLQHLVCKGTNGENPIKPGCIVMEKSAWKSIYRISDFTLVQYLGNYWENGINSSLLHPDIAFVLKLLLLIVKLITGGGQKLCTGRVVLPVADNIFKWMFFASVLLVSDP